MRDLEVKDIKRLTGFGNVTVRLGVFTVKAGMEGGLLLDIIPEKIEDHYSTVEHLYVNGKYQEGNVVKRVLVELFARGVKNNEQFIRFKVVPNREQVRTYNMLNRDAGPVMIAACNLGGCTDPATETYHCS